MAPLLIRDCEAGYTSLYVNVVSSSGVATGGQGGQSAPLDSKKNCQKSGKRGRISGNNKEKENREKSGMFFHFAPHDR